jgi:uncharacterized protein YndB with AHSA1/START domain
MPATATATATESQPIQTLEIRKEEFIEAPIEIAFEALLDELGPQAQMPDGKTLSMKIEAWPGGRWYRDLGNNAGHFWAHVQVIKPPALLELSGPMPMSYPAQNHIQYRLTKEGSGTRIQFTHRGIGLIPQEHRDGMGQGWEIWLKRVRENAERRASTRGKGK